MKSFVDRSAFISAVVLAAIVSLGTNLTILDSAIAYPETVNHRGIFIGQNPSAQATRLPPQVANAIRKDLSKRTGIAPGKLEIKEYKSETWPDGCLGLAKPDQICTQALVEGWRVVVSDGNKTWVYRSDRIGKVLALEENVSTNSPKSNLKPVQIPASELPPPLDKGVIFQSISSGGIAGRTYQTTLLNDGRLMRVRIGDANDSERSVRQIPPQQVREFQKLLARPGLSRFHSLSYLAPNGAADYITVTLVSSSFSTRYADIVQDSLPKPLQQVVQAWNQIAGTR